jgi:hypothetical protein
MTLTSFFPICAPRSLVIASLLSLGLAACGASPARLGESEQPFTAGDGDSTAAGDPESGTTEAACAGGALASDAAEGDCQVLARGLCFSTTEAACACAGCASAECAIGESFPAQAFCPSNGTDPDGSSASEPSTPVSDDASTPVGSDPQGGGSSGYPGSTPPASPGGGNDGSPGCGQPGQTEPAAPSVPAACSAGAPRDPTGSERCDFVVAGACFDSSASACACAGCAEDQCLVLESYPAQVGCQQ